MNNNHKLGAKLFELLEVSICGIQPEETASEDIHEAANLVDSLAIEEDLNFKSIVQVADFKYIRLATKLKINELAEIFLKELNKVAKEIKLEKDKKEWLG